MATVRHAIDENDVVELRDAVGDCPAGISGTVVSERGKWKLVEITDDRGVMLDLSSVPEPYLRLIAKHDAWTAQRLWSSSRRKRLAHAACYTPTRRMRLLVLG